MERNLETPLLGPTLKVLVSAQKVLHDALAGCLIWWCRGASSVTDETGLFLHVNSCES
jgi:hypothetical protein